MPSLEVGMVAEACRVSVSRSNHNGSVREIQIGFGRLLSTCQSCNLKFGKTFYWAVQKMHSFFILLLTDKIKYDMYLNNGLFHLCIMFNEVCQHIFQNFSNRKFIVDISN
jgi:hypothetical protein